MFNPFKKKKTNRVRFYNLCPGVKTLYPVTRASDLQRDWVSEEKKRTRDNPAQCPFRGIFFEGLSVAKCPALTSYMRSGYIVYSPIDVAVKTNGDGQSIGILNIADTHRRPKAMNVSSTDISKLPFVSVHPAEQTHMLRDSTKDTTLNEILKFTTYWRVMCDEDIVFLVMKVPYVKESRFSAVNGIFDPRQSPEINIQLWWHMFEGETVIKAGTPLAAYIPVSRKLLEHTEFILDDATDEDLNMEESAYLMLNNAFPEQGRVTVKIRKIVDDRWRKYIG
jgi:hypothetical protein